ncbi:hypothetical protein BV898_11223 [Hypsibius exemplaris]|uniref:3'-5' exonuclease domain-containing protein n=1 Tax=Hypsibius exemplaris TaxID=2072580 RepID=A0A1W0WHC4_HYPEX|nr:hypothetical protein BV898_11223 [Hypsibius exemplaris]
MATTPPDPDQHPYSRRVYDPDMRKANGVEANNGEEQEEENSKNKFDPKNSQSDPLRCLARDFALLQASVNPSHTSLQFRPLRPLLRAVEELTDDLVVEMLDPQQELPAALEYPHLFIIFDEPHLTASLGKVMAYLRTQKTISLVLDRFLSTMQPREQPERRVEKETTLLEDLGKGRGFDYLDGITEKRARREWEKMRKQSRSASASAANSASAVSASASAANSASANSASANSASASANSASANSASASANSASASANSASASANSASASANSASANSASASANSASANSASASANSASASANSASAARGACARMELTTSLLAPSATTQTCWDAGRPEERPGTTGTSGGATIACTLSGATIAGTLSGATIAGTFGGATIACTLSDATVAGTSGGATIAGTLSCATVAGTSGGATIVNATANSALSSTVKSPLRHRACLILATRHFIFVFDCLRISLAHVLALLRPILEDETVHKVVCDFDSDRDDLLQQYGIIVRNHYDVVRGEMNLAGSGRRDAARRHLEERRKTALIRPFTMQEFQQRYKGSALCFQRFRETDFTPHQFLNEDGTCLPRSLNKLPTAVMEGVLKQVAYLDLIKRCQMERFSWEAVKATEIRMAGYYATFDAWFRDSRAEDHEEERQELGRDDVPDYCLGR